MELSAWMRGQHGPPGPPERGAVTIDGARMEYLRLGEGPPLLLLHGLLGTANHWDRVLAPLARERMVIAPDALGIGGSERLPGLDVSLRAAAGRVTRLMDALELPKATLLGTSHGGAVAMMLAAQYPERIASLVLHAPVNPFSRAADGLIRFYTSRVGRWCAHRAPYLSHWVQRRAVATMYGDGRRMPEDSVRKYVESLRIPGTVDYVLRILERWPRDMRELDAALPQLSRFPALLLWGECDRTVSRESLLALRSYFASAELVLLPGTGHLPFEELPQQFVATVDSFLSGRRGLGSHAA